MAVLPSREPDDLPAFCAQFVSVFQKEAQPVFETFDPPDREFNFGLERILDGIGGLMAARSGPPPDPAK